jgi:hypothetical protein
MLLSYERERERESERERERERKGERGKEGERTSCISSLADNYTRVKTNLVLSEYLGRINSSLE